MDPIDFTLWALFARATLTVKLVMLLLLAASVYSWAIIIQKHLAFRSAKRAAKKFDRAFWSGEPLDGLYSDVADKPRNAPERIFVAGMTEWQRSYKTDGAMIPGASMRIDRNMDVAIAREAERLNAGLPFLATVGSTAPFIGLFGTVWGIMHSFEQIAVSQSTNLAVVAPGISEALLATGIGLLAAIPAVIFYNKLTSESARLVGGYEVFADEFATLLSRESA
ncbi:MULTISPECIES: protein TolQ [Meridianimarinicoccus]|uniref:Tol-Pal system protein TolQ n=1 Tax=Meridianimarinicoccus marinus TaxID=3231483 RepID=A0ABV3L2E2_9RHOB|nr:protein TolQ [Fluviibacterium sp. MJW13]